MRASHIGIFVIVGSVCLPDIAWAGPNVKLEGDSTEVVRISTDSTGTGLRIDSRASGISMNLSGHVGKDSTIGVYTSVGGAPAINFGAIMEIWSVLNHVPSFGVLLSTTTDDSGHSEGLYVRSYGGDGSFNRAIYAAAVGGAGSENYAAYLDGDVVITGDCTGCSVSDVKFKKNLQPLDAGLAKIMALKPTSFEMKVEEFRDRIVLGKGGRKYGFVAQDLEQVVPEVVHTVRAPARLTPEESRRGAQKEDLEFKAVNQGELIPILVSAMQEQQAQIEALKQKVQQLEGGR